MADKEWTIADSIADMEAVHAADQATEWREELTDFATNLYRLIDRSFYGPKHQEILAYAPPDVSNDGREAEIPVFSGTEDYVIIIRRR